MKNIKRRLQKGLAAGLSIMLFMGTIPVSALATEAQETGSDTTASIVEMDAVADSIQEPEYEEIQTEETEDAIQTDEMSENEMDQEDIVVEDTTDDLLPEQVETFAASAVEKNKYDSYEQFLAYYYLTYSSLDYYLNNDELPYQTYVKNADESFKKSLENWRLATLDAGSLVKYSTKEVEFYEMIVFDILYQNVSEDTVLKNAETSVNALQSSLVKDLAETGYEWTMDIKVTEENADEILNRLISLDNLKFLSKEVSTLKKGIKYTKTMEELIEKLSMLIKLKSCSTEVKSILTDLYNKSTDEQMKEGCRQLALVASGLMNEEEIIGIFSGQIALKSVSEYALEKIWKGVISSTSLGKGFEIGQKVGKLASNALCSTDKIVENWYSMEQICKFEKVLKAQLLVYKNNFVNNPTCENARIFNQAVNMYLNTQSVGMTYAIKYVEAVKGGGLFGYIYKNFTNKDDYNQLVSQLNSIKRNIDLTVEFANNNTHDFYLDDMQANGVEIPWESSNSDVTQKDVEDSGKDVSDSLFKLTNQYVSEDTSYSEDKLTYGSYYLKNGATLDLQGKTLTVYGDFYCEGTLQIRGGTLNVLGNLYVPSGYVDVNGGKIAVGENAYFVKIGTDGRYSGHGGTLTMDNEKDEFTIGGDFITYLNISGYYFNAKNGTIRIGGGWTNYSEIYNSGNLRVVFTGDKDITINGIEKIFVEYMQIETESKRTVHMKGSISTNQLEGKNINLVAEKNPYLYFKTTTGSLDITGNCQLAVPTKSGGDISVSGDLYSNGIAVGANTLSVDGTLYLNSNNTLQLGASGKLNVSSDVWMKSGTLSLAGTTQISGNLYQEAGTVNVNGGLVKIGKDYRMQGSDDSSGELMWSTGKGSLVMTKVKDRVVVGGDFYMQSSVAHQLSRLSAGTLAVMGDFYQISDDKASAYNFQPSGTHTVMLAGSSPQKVVIQSEKSRFNRLQLTQSIDHYTFQPDECWNTKEEGVSVPGEFKFCIAEGYCGNNLTWVLTSDGTITFSGTGDMRNYSSASSTSWYAYRDQIKSVELEDGITSIGNFAFYGLENLTDVTIPEGVTSIGGFAFKNCISLETVDLPSTLKKLGESAFFGCSKLSKIVIPEGIYTIWGYTFKNCTSLKEVTLPSTLIKVDEAAFYGCSSLKELEIPSNVSIIGIYCFKNCTSLAKVTLPEKLTEIREAVFYATALPEITIPEGVKKIGPYAFKNCTALKTVTLPETLTSVGEASFYSCTALTEIKLPDNVTSIGNYAFRRCENLGTLNLSANLETVGESAFYGCTGLKILTIPENVSVIGAYAFKNCTGVTEVSLPESLKELGDSAFYGCTAVKEIVFPENISKVGAYAFSRCSSLSQVTFRGNAPEIGDSAFSKVTAMVSYPANKNGWTQDKRNNYGGTLSWEEK